MPISGVVIKCSPEDVAAVAGELSGFESLEVHHQLRDTLVAVIESSSVDGEMSIISRINGVAGVLDVRLAYHNFEDLNP